METTFLTSNTKEMIKMYFERMPDFVEELLVIHYYNSYELFRIKSGIKKFGKENNREYDFDVDEERKEVLITVDEYDDYRKLKYLILTGNNH